MKKLIDNCEIESGETCPVDLHTEVLRCKAWVGDTVQGIQQELKHVHTRVDNVEASNADQRESLRRVDRKLEKAEEQREKFSDYMAGEVRSLKDTVAKLSDNDDKRHEEVVGHLSKLSEHVNALTETTVKNSDYISEAEAKKREEQYAQEKIQEVLAPRQKIKEKIIMTAVTVITAGVLATLWQFIVMGYDLTELVNQAKTVSGK